MAFMIHYSKLRRFLIPLPQNSPDARHTASLSPPSIATESGVSASGKRLASLSAAFPACMGCFHGFKCSILCQRLTNVEIEIKEPSSLNIRAKEQAYVAARTSKSNIVLTVNTPKKAT